MARLSPRMGGTINKSSQVGDFQTVFQGTPGAPWGTLWKGFTEATERGKLQTSTPDPATVPLLSIYTADFPLPLNKTDPIAFFFF